MNQIDRVSIPSVPSVVLAGFVAFVEAAMLGYLLGLPSGRVSVVVLFTTVTLGPLVLGISYANAGPLGRLLILITVGVGMLALLPG